MTQVNVVNPPSRFEDVHSEVFEKFQKSLFTLDKYPYCSWSNLDINKQTTVKPVLQYAC